MFRFVVFQSDDGSSFRRQWLGVAYLATSLKRVGIAVEAGYYTLDNVDAAVAAAAASRPRLIGLPVLHLNLFAVQKFVRLIRALLPDVHIVLGNVEAWGLGEKAFDFMPEIDTIVVGEGERTLTDLAQRVLNGGSLLDCAGIIWRRKNGVVMKNLPRPLDEDLDVLGAPDRSLAAAEHVVPYPFSIKGSRGCESHCTFCECWVGRRHQPGPRVRNHSMEFMLDEMERGVQKYDAHYVSFEDDSFEDRSPDPATAFDELYEGIRSRNLKVRFVFNCRAESVTEESAKALQRLRTVGMDLLFSGIDGGNQPDLKVYGKAATLSDNHRAAKLLREHGVTLDYGFIMFNPFSTFQSLRQNADFLEAAGLDVDAPILQRRLEIYQGSAITIHVRNKGLLNPENDPIVTDSFGYRFAEDRMTGVWAILRELDNIPVHSDFLDLVKSFSRKIKDDPEIDERGARLIALVDEFRHESARLWLAFFRSTLDLADAGRPGFERQIRSEMNEVRGQLADMWAGVSATVARWSADELRPWGLDLPKGSLDASSPLLSTSAAAIAS